MVISSIINPVINAVIIIMIGIIRNRKLLTHIEVVHVILV